MPSKDRTDDTNQANKKKLMKQMFNFYRFYAYHMSYSNQMLINKMLDDSVDPICLDDFQCDFTAATRNITHNNYIDFLVAN